MSNKQRQQWAALLTGMVMFLTLFQGLIPTMPIRGQPLTVLSAVTLFLVAALTYWKQYISNLINNNAAKATLLAAIVATLMGIIDLLDVFNFGATTSQWVRFSITLVVAFINYYSQQMFPQKGADYWLIKNNNTGEYLTAYSTNPIAYTFGSKADALQFNSYPDADDISRAVGDGAIVPVKGF